MLGVYLEKGGTLPDLFVQTTQYTNEYFPWFQPRYVLETGRVFNYIATFWPHPVTELMMMTIIEPQLRNIFFEVLSMFFNIFLIKCNTDFNVNILFITSKKTREVRFSTLLHSPAFIFGLIYQNLQSRFFCLFQFSFIFIRSTTFINKISSSCLSNFLVIQCKFNLVQN